jgi:hypothetical protein
MRGGAVVSFAMVLIAGASCIPNEDCSNAACGTGPAVRVLLTEKNAGEVIPITTFDSVGVLLPGTALVKVSNESRLVAVPVPQQPPDQTFRIFKPVYEPVPGKPWTYGGAVTLSSPAAGTRREWQVTLIIGTDPLTKTDGRSAYPSYFSGASELKLALGQTFTLNWPVGFAPPSSSDERVLAPVTGVIAIDEGYANIAVTRVTAGLTYEEQLFLAVGSGQAVLSLPRAVGSQGCANKDTQGHCLETPTLFVESRPTWRCSVDDGCSQVNWDGVSRDRPEQYQR